MKCPNCRTELVRQNFNADHSTFYCYECEEFHFSSIIRHPYLRTIEVLEVKK